MVRCKSSLGVDVPAPAGQSQIGNQPMFFPKLRQSSQIAPGNSVDLLPRITSLTRRVATSIHASVHQRGLQFIAASYCGLRSLTRLLHGIYSLLL